MAKLSKGFFMRKICRQEQRSIFISLCGRPSHCDSWLEGELRRQRIQRGLRRWCPAQNPKPNHLFFKNEIISELIQWDFSFFLFFFGFKASHLNKRKIHTGTPVCTKSPKLFELASYPPKMFFVSPLSAVPCCIDSPPSHLPANKKKQILILCLSVSKGSCLSIAATRQ